jgi:formylglycine-generating enzyme required for sulfatase activity
MSNHVLLINETNGRQMTIDDQGRVIYFIPSAAAGSSGWTDDWKAAWKLVNASAPDEMLFLRAHNPGAPALRFFYNVLEKLRHQAPGQRSWTLTAEEFWKLCPPEWALSGRAPDKNWPTRLSTLVCWLVADAKPTKGPAWPSAQEANYVRLLSDFRHKLKMKTITLPTNVKFGTLASSSSSATVVTAGGALPPLSQGRQTDAPAPGCFPVIPFPIRPTGTGARARTHDLVLVRGASFERGGPGSPDTDPPHRVLLGPFVIGKFPVTEEEYGAANSSSTVTSYGRLPQVNVEQKKAVEFAREWGLGLPSEAQWEYAAGGPGTEAERRPFPWGWSPPARVAAARMANYTCTLEDAEFKLVEATRRKIDDFPKGISYVGAFDMAGNVWEFCADNYRLYPESNEVFIDPICRQPESESFVVRGGSFERLDSHGSGQTRSAEMLRCTYRGRETKATDRNGFRLGCPVDWHFLSALFDLGWEGSSPSGKSDDVPRPEAEAIDRRNKVYKHLARFDPSNCDVTASALRQVLDKEFGGLIEVQKCLQISLVSPMGVVVVHEIESRKQIEFPFDLRTFAAAVQIKPQGVIRWVDRVQHLVATASQAAKAARSKMPRFVFAAYAWLPNLRLILVVEAQQWLKVGRIPPDTKGVEGKTADDAARAAIEWAALAGWIISERALKEWCGAPAEPSRLPPGGSVATKSSKDKKQGGRSTKPTADGRARRHRSK